MTRTPVTSTDLCSVGYDPVTRTLEIEFASGGVYQYSDVPPEVFEELLVADSPGRYFHARIRARYPTRRVS
jgi:hypothetical protein